jgi:predicted secreted Zn-dependent protease
MMNRVRLSLALAVVIAAAITAVGLQESGKAAPTTGLAPSRFIETVHHYEVTGTSLDDLREDVFSRGPYDRTKGRRFAGWTEWRISWSFDHRFVPEGCAIGRARTDTEISYTLPRWTEQERAPRALQEAWRRFSDALTEHEKGHGRIARQLAMKIEAAIEGMPPAASCGDLEVQANVLVNRLIAEDREQEAYDLRTGHGARQGAAFPRALVSAP